MGDSGAMSLRSRRTVCPFCSSGCGLYLRGAAGAIEGVAPSEHHPISGGRLCARGWAAHEAAQWGPRLRTPLLRCEGELQPASWADALAAAASGFRALLDAGRPTGVLASGRASNEESWLALALARRALRTPHLDAPLRRQWDALLRGFGAAQAPPAGRFAALEDSDLVLLLEDDLATSHPRVAVSLLRALRRGARLVTIGWQRSQLAELATRHVALDPGAPLATLAGLRAHEGIGDLLEGARRPSFVIAPFDADPAVLRQAAALLAELAAGLPDARTLLLPLPVRSNTRGSDDMGVAPDHLPGRRPLDDGAARAGLRSAWGDDGCWESGLDADVIADEVAGLLVVGEDLPAGHPHPVRVRDRLAALEHLVVVDAFLTETAAAAQVVLPAAAFGESEGCVTGLEDRIQLLQPLVPPPGDARPGWQILLQLLEALGVPLRVRTVGEVRAAIAASVPGYGALSGPALENEWPMLISDAGGGPDADATPSAPAALAETPPSAGGRRLLLRRTGAFDWEQDAMVRYSPTLRRDSASRARRFPHGLVAVSPADAAELKVKDGWTVRLQGAGAEAQVGLAVRPGVEPGRLLVPYAFRERLEPLLGAEGVAEVEVQPA